MLMRLIANRWLHTLILLGMLAGAVTLKIYDLRHNSGKLTRPMSAHAFDFYNKVEPRTPTRHVAMVDIDEESLSRPELGQWPWSRDIMAQLVRNLHALGARAIVFDMVFAEADRSSPQTILDRMSPELRTPEMEALLSAVPDNDETFAKAIAEANNVVLGFVWTDETEATRHAPHLSKPITVARTALAVTEHAPRIPAVADNLPLFAKAAAGGGSFGVIPEGDGLIRKVPLLFSYREEGMAAPIMYPSLAVEALRVAQSPKMVVKVRALSGEEAGDFNLPLKMSVGNYEVPMDAGAQMFVHFAPERQREYIPAWKVIAKAIPPEDISGRIVFVGTSAIGLKDIRSTPLNLYVPGVELHMNVVEQIMEKKFLIRPEFIEQGAEPIAIIALGCLIIVLAPFIGAIYMTLFTFALVVGMTALSWHMFITQGLLIDPVYPSLCLLAIFVVATLLTYVRTEYERSRVRQAFGLYISPDFMEELTRDPDKLKLGGETRELTVMFTDIRGFTTISESMSPEALTQLMNSFLTPMSDLVMETRGTIDKYMGDAMMAFWNAPLDDAEHARHACMAALRMYNALAPVNEELKVRAQAERRTPVVLNAGIGINTGTASVGNMGSRQRFAYSALGDTVNLASRLEGQTKAYGVNILISEATAAHVPDFASLELDMIRVKGKNEPVRIFTLLGEEDMAAQASFRQWHERHGQMMAAYRAAAFDDALRLIGECRALSGGTLDGFYAVFAARIEDMKAEPPAPGWDGVYVATSK